MHILAGIAIIFLVLVLIEWAGGRTSSRPGGGFYPRR
jgi:hypothetical protein